LILNIVGSAVGSGCPKTGPARNLVGCLDGPDLMAVDLVGVDLVREILRRVAMGSPSWY
jgi:hypothetical protein